MKIMDEAFVNFLGKQRAMQLIKKDLTDVVKEGDELIGFDRIKFIMVKL